MFSSKTNIQSISSDFRLDRMMRYSHFAPRLYNLCRTFGFEAGHIMPSRAFCSDESQGFPVILIAKHFGAFPFNHGRTGGIVATARHGPHAHHGKDLVIIQASHVGYDPINKNFGHYCRLQTEENALSTTCGKVGNVISRYETEYKFAQNRILLGYENETPSITIDNQLLDNTRNDGLILNLEKMVQTEDGQPKLLRTLSTSGVYAAAKEFHSEFSDADWPKEKHTRIGDYLTAERFTFRRSINERDQLEKNLFNPMPWIVTSTTPMLLAAQFNTQAEFDRTYRTIVKEPEYQNKRLLFISCLNIDISPEKGQVFPHTKCVPWAAYYQNGDGESQTFEQTEIIDLLIQQSGENQDAIDLESAIQQMIEANEIKISV